MAATDSTRTRAAETGARRGLESEVWAAMSELVMSQRPRMIALCREFELFPPQLLVLRALDRPRPMREVAAQLACDSSNLTGITDRLEERGLVRRSPDPDDRRVKRLVLSEEGRALREQVISRMGAPPVSFERLSDRDLATLRRLLAKATAES